MTVLLAQSLIPGLLGLAVVVFLIVVVMMIPRLRRRRAGTDRPREMTDAERGTAGRIQRSLERLMVELFDMSRDINAQLQTRIETLNQLIRDADDRIVRLNRLAGQDGATPAEPADRQEPTPEATGPGASADEGPALKTGTVADPDHREIYELSDQGATPTEIARKTGRPLGEVQLILDLRRAQH